AAEMTGSKILALSRHPAVRTIAFDRQVKLFQVTTAPATATPTPTATATNTAAATATATNTASATPTSSPTATPTGTSTSSPTATSLPTRTVTTTAASPTATPTPAASCPCSLWDSATTPAIPDFPDVSAIELGVRFRADVAGQLTGIRFYKGTLNTGTH